MYVRIFHIGNYTNIWYNKTLLAWYFKEVKSSSLTGDLQIGPHPFPAPTFWSILMSEAEAPTWRECALSHERDEVFTNYISLRFRILRHRPVCFHHLKSSRRYWWCKPSCIQHTQCQADGVLLQLGLFVFVLFFLSLTWRKTCLGLLNTKEKIFA